MGAISFLFYNMTNPPINIDFSKCFVKMKKRGGDNTRVIIESSPIINNSNIQQTSSFLSKRQIHEYKPFTFQLGFHRLAINDLTLDGSQPFEDPINFKIGKYPELRIRPKRKLLCNGEIYNYRELIDTFNFNDRDLQSDCDCEIILPLYIKETEQTGDSEQGLIGCLKQLNGDFSFIITENLTSFDLTKINIFAVRDPLGTKPLYMVKYFNNDINDIFYMFVSELKGIPVHILQDPEYSVVQVPPGCYWSFQNFKNNKGKNDYTEFINYHTFDSSIDINNCSISSADPITISKIYNDTISNLTNSIISRYHRDIGVLLSGGFDSCIITSILVKFLVEKGDKFDLHVFTFGDPDQENPDTIRAKEHVLLLEKVYNIDIHHHIVSIYDNNLIYKEIDNVIYKLESFDPKTIQHSLPFDFLMKYISEFTNVKVLLSGDGLDELCGHSQLFDKSDSNFQEKSIKLLENLCKFDLLRMDKIAGSYGLEIRYPFLDLNLIEFILDIHPILKRPQMSGFSKTPIEKYLFRKAFDTNSDIVIDKKTLWNNREDITRRMENGKGVYFENDEQEKIYYKKVFDNFFPNMSHILPCYWEQLF